MKVSSKIVSLSLLALSFSSLGFSSGAFCGSQVLMSVSGASSEFELFKAKIQSQGKAFQVLQDRTDKYENDNSFVQLYNARFNSDGVQVANRSIDIVIPSTLYADALMELLIKIRAAKTFGANEVIIQSAIPLASVALMGEMSFGLSLEELMAVAGADQVVEGDLGSRDLHEVKPRKNKVLTQDFWVGSSNHMSLSEQIAAQLGKSSFGFESFKRDPGLLRGRKIYWVAAVQAPVNEQFFTTLAQIRWMERQGASVHLIAPYLPYARSDKPEFDVGVTAQGRLVADLIEGVGTEGITVVRAHAPQSLGFFKIYSHEISGRRLIIEYLKDKNVDCIISPDAGFQKDATKYQHELSEIYRANGITKDVCLVVMNKERNSDGKEQILGGTGVEKLRDKNVVIIDDETATGGTLDKVANALKDYHTANTFAVVTHLAGPAKKSLESDFIQKLIVSDTVPVPRTHEKLEVLSVSREISDWVKSVEKNRSIDE